MANKNKLSIYLIKDEFAADDTKILKSDVMNSVYFGKADLEELGIAYFSPSQQKTPYWVSSFFRDRITAEDIFTSNARAVLITRVEMSDSQTKTFALTMGYGKYMLADDVIEEDFGLKVVLNTIPKDSLRRINKINIGGNLKLVGRTNGARVWPNSPATETRRFGNMRILKSMEEMYLVRAAEFVGKVFTESEDAESGDLVRRLVLEVRSKRFYLPELELIMVDGNDGIIVFPVPSESRCEDELLLLSPVAVKTELQRHHISKELIEYGLAKAREMGYRAVIVEGNPRNYRSRGFVTSAPYGITAHESVGLPAVECLMVQELVPGGLDGITGQVRYDLDYETLR